MSKKTNKASESFDWSRLDSMTDDEVRAAALADPDPQPWTDEQLAKARRTPRLKDDAGEVCRAIRHPARHTARLGARA